MSHIQTVSALISAFTGGFALSCSMTTYFDERPWKGWAAFSAMSACAAALLAFIPLPTA